MMTSFILGLSLIAAAGDDDVIVEKEIRYQKETTVDLTGSDVSGESKLPPAFFVNKMQTPNAESLLSERLKFPLRNYNRTGF